MESMDCSDQNTELKMFGSTKKAYGDFCCVPMMFKSEREWQNQGVEAVILQIC